MGTELQFLILYHLDGWKNSRHIAYNISWLILVSENYCILIQMALKLVSDGAIGSITAFVQHFFLLHFVNDAYIKTPTSSVI